MQSVLQRQVGQAVEFGCSPGKSGWQNWEKVNEKVAHLSQLTGAEYSTPWLPSTKSQRSSSARRLNRLALRHGDHSIITLLLIRRPVIGHWTHPSGTINVVRGMVHSIGRKASALLDTVGCRRRFEKLITKSVLSRVSQTAGTER